MIKSSIHKNIRYLRRQRGISQSALGTAVGLTRSKIASYESGKAEPNAIGLCGLAEFFQVRVEDFVTRDIEKIDREFAPDRSAEPDQQSDSKSISDLKKAAAGFRSYYELHKLQFNKPHFQTRTLMRMVENLLDLVDLMVCKKKKE